MGLGSDLRLELMFDIGARGVKKGGGLSDLSCAIELVRNALHHSRLLPIRWCVLDLGVPGDGGEGSGEERVGWSG